MTCVSVAYTLYIQGLIPVVSVLSMYQKERNPQDHEHELNMSRGRGDFFMKILLSGTKESGRMLRGDIHITLARNRAFSTPPPPLLACCQYWHYPSYFITLARPSKKDLVLREWISSAIYIFYCFTSKRTNPIKKSLIFVKKIIDLLGGQNNGMTSGRNDLVHCF